MTKHIVITGGTRGIGFGLAKEFIKLGHKITICGTTQAGVTKAMDTLNETGEGIVCQGFVCDVRSGDQIREFWNQLTQHFGPVHIWINNAGLNQPDIFFHQIDDEDIANVVDVNITGVMLATKIAYRKMIKQGFGTIYNMEGFGSNNRKMEKMASYGTSKKAVRYFTESFIRETKGSNVKICFLSPGMVITDLLLAPIRQNPENNQAALKILNILSDEIETVTPWLAKKIDTNTKHGKRIAWLTPTKITARFIKSIFHNRKIIEKHL